MKMLKKLNHMEESHTSSLRMTCHLLKDLLKNTVKKASKYFSHR